MNKYFLDKKIYVKEYALVEVKHNFILDYCEKNNLTYFSIVSSTCHSPTKDV